MWMPALKFSYPEQSQEQMLEELRKAKDSPLIWPAKVEEIPPQRLLVLRREVEEIDETLEGHPCRA